MKNSPTIWLVGLMGAGKSSVGKLLAQRLGLEFIDTDERIVAQEGASIAEIFDRHGEVYFRDRERQVIRKCVDRPAVVALGGGAIAQPGMSGQLARAGTVVYLRARVATLAERVADATDRPLLNGLSRAERAQRLDALLGKRAPYYETAQLVLDTDGLSAREVVDRLLVRLRQGGRKQAVQKERREMREVRVELGERSYAICLGDGTLESVGAEIVQRTQATRAVVVTVPTVSARYAPTVIRSLKAAGVRAARIEVPDGDATKNLRQVAKLYDQLLELEADRRTVIVSLGGGMVGDLAGFVAASYLRGVPFVQIPTTVLSMVDASIGGKVGVNLKQGKNLVGAFYQPSLVWIDTKTLRSLPARERAAGVAEIIKAAAIWDAGFFVELETKLERLLTLDGDTLLPVLERACAIKAEVVSRDERESGLRMLLNFGHTLAHAIETLKKYRGILHGEAVAIGMVFAARRSEELGLAPSGVTARLQALLERAGLPTKIPDFPHKAYLDALRVDKKKHDATLHFVALREIGRAETVPLGVREIYPASAKSARAKKATPKPGRAKSRKR